MEVVLNRVNQQKPPVFLSKCCVPPEELLCISLNYRMCCTNRVKNPPRNGKILSTTFWKKVKCNILIEHKGGF